MASRLNAHSAFLVYAGLATSVGAGIVASGLNGHVPYPHLPAITFGRASLVWIGGMVLVAAGLSAFGLARVEEPRAGRRALRLFALAHLLVGLIVLSQWSLFWRGVFSAPVAVAPLVVGALLVLCSLVLRIDTPGPSAGEHLRSRYEAQLREAGRIEERSRLARDLHDAVKQQLFVIQTAAATSTVRFDSDPDGARDALRHIRAAAREAMTEMEALIDELQARPLENAGLIEAIKKQCEALRFRTGANVTLEVGRLPPNDAVLPGTHDALYRVGQEALANVARHARATHVRVRLAMQGSRLQLRVVDDGSGFDAGMSNTGMGQRNMRTRATDIGGTLRVTSASGAGTEVLFEAPIRSRVTMAPWKTAAHTALIFVFVLSRSLLDGSWSRDPWLLGVGAVMLLHAIFSTWRTSRKAAAA